MDDDDNYGQLQEEDDLDSALEQDDGKKRVFVFEHSYILNTKSYGSILFFYKL